MKRLFGLLFGCGHRHTTFPQTKDECTYIVCLDCGSKFDYSWREMRAGKAF